MDLTLLRVTKPSMWPLYASIAGSSPLSLAPIEYTLTCDNSNSSILPLGPSFLSRVTRAHVGHGWRHNSRIGPPSCRASLTLVYLQQAASTSTLAMSSPPGDGSSNGQRSPRSPSPSPKIASRRSSLSEQSELQDAHPAASPSPSPDPDDETIYINGGHDFAESSNSPDRNNASDDGDFDMDDEVVNAQSDGGDAAADARSSSGDSHRSLKRKAGQDEDRFIKANPELYGLRRSVRPVAASLRPAPS